MSRKLSVGSLFSGIGGIDLGLERAGMVTRWFSEIDPYACKVLAKHWPDVPNLGDITKIDFRQVEPVDVLCGGFPCQDLSHAGKRAGMDGERSGLWGEYARAIRDLRPGYVLVENVAALLSGGDGEWAGRFFGDLAALGYDAEWDCIPASAVGAPHQRDRAWVVAYPVRQRPAAGTSSGLREGALHDGHRVNPRDAAGRSLVKPRTSRGGADVANPALVLGNGGNDHTRGGGEGPRAFPEPRDGRRALRTRSGWWDVEPGVGRVAHGLPRGLVENALRGLGNAVVPQIPELIGGWIIEHARASGYLEAVA